MSGCTAERSEPLCAAMRVDAFEQRCLASTPPQPTKRSGFPSQASHSAFHVVPQSLLRSKRVNAASADIYMSTVWCCTNPS